MKYVQFVLLLQHRMQEINFRLLPAPAWCVSEK